MARRAVRKDCEIAPALYAIEGLAARKRIALLTTRRRTRQQKREHRGSRDQQDERCYDKQLNRFGQSLDNAVVHLSSILTPITYSGAETGTIAQCRTITHDADTRGPGFFRYRSLMASAVQYASAPTVLGGLYPWV